MRKQRSADAVDKDIWRRRAGVKVGPSGTGGRKVATPKPRSAAQVDKDILARRLGVKVPPRGRLSDAATGRLTGKNKGVEAVRLYKRDRKGRFDD